MPKVRVGISGWTFPGWKGTFYPEDLPKRAELDYASNRVNSIEINGTFYSLQRPHSFQKWHDETPKDFQFAVKAPQFITHILRLKEAAEPLANFFASGVLCLEKKLGPVLWQFPPNVMLKDDRFEKFLALLPQDSRTGAKLARKHGKKVEGRAYTEPRSHFPIRHAMEFRHKSFLNKDFMALMRHQNVAFVFAHEGGEKAPYTEEATADFIYARLHGEGKTFAKGYPERELTIWSKKVEAWSKKGLDSYVYFNSEAKEYAPSSALKLMKRLGIDQIKSKKAA